MRLSLSLSPDQVAAVNLLVMLTKQRGKDTLQMYLGFLNNVFVQYSQAQLLTLTLTLTLTLLPGRTPNPKASPKYGNLCNPSLNPTLG